MSTSHLRPPSLLRLLGAWRALDSAQPAYRQLAQALRMLVLDGRIGLNVRLPGERELAAALGLSRTTIAAAFDRLRDEGYLESRQGSGSVTRLPPGDAPAPPTSCNKPLPVRLDERLYRVVNLIGSSFYTQSF